jgi:Spy/CpxP family protein refolding chaperone
MKKVVIVLSCVAILAMAVTAFAHGPGWGRGYMMGPGFGNMWTGYGPGACGGPGACLREGGYDQKFLDETVALRKELHQKKFEYMEAVRNPQADEKSLSNLEKEIGELQDKIHDKAPKGMYGRGYGRFSGYGCRW